MNGRLQILGVNPSQAADLKPAFLFKLRSAHQCPARALTRCGLAEWDNYL